MVQSYGRGHREETEDQPGQDTLRSALSLGGGQAPRLPRVADCPASGTHLAKGEDTPYTECRYMAEEDRLPRTPLQRD